MAGEQCLACDLTDGRRPLPGGRIHETKSWLVEHCVGPLGVGTLVVKPFRHVTGVWALSRDEAVELGPLLALTSNVVERLVQPDQIYVCLWSHAGGKPGHLHFVVQPITEEVMATFEMRGPNLQAAMFDRGELPDEAAVVEFADRARVVFRESSDAG